MRSNYKKLGPYIKEVDTRNTENIKENLLGVSTKKIFIKSVANTVGTNFRRYKVVKRNQFTYVPDTSRRGDKIGIAMLENLDQALVSQAYTVFKVIDENVLNPEYLMMWFRRPEFDRFARFKSHGSVREIFGWEEMCEVELPVPDVEKQCEIVAEYNTVKNRMALNNQLIQMLEETAQTIYKHWFVDFEFPDENGNPYKSSGGKMVWNEELEKEIPEGWKMGSLNELVDIIDGDRGSNYPSIEEMYEKGFCLFLNAGNVTKIGFDFSETKFITKGKDKELRKGKLKRNDIILTTRGTVGNVGFYSEAITFNDIRINSGMVIMRAKEISESTIFIYSMLRNSEIKKAIENYLSGSAQPQLPIKDLVKIPILIPEKVRVVSFSLLVLKIQIQIDKMKIQNLKLKDFADLLFSKLATIEN